MLEIKNISKTYSRQGKDFFAVKEVNLNILDGDFVHIIGRSGSGKSTLLNIVAGLLSADNGTLLLDGTNYLELNDEEKSKFRNKNKDDFITNFEFIYTNEKCVAYRRNNILCIINLDSKAHFIEDYSGEKIFGNNEIYSTPFGTVVSPNSYIAIKVK